jgi:hypothetical protein
MTRDGHSAGDFGDPDRDALVEAKPRFGLDNLIMVNGPFQDSFPIVPGLFGIVHIACDIYSAVKYAQMAVWPRMTRGGYVVCDDADASSCISATEAVEELIQTGRHSEQVWSVPLRVSRGAGGRAWSVRASPHWRNWIGDGGEAQGQAGQGAPGQYYWRLTRQFEIWW